VRSGNAMNSFLADSLTNGGFQHQRQSRDEKPDHDGGRDCHTHALRPARMAPSTPTPCRNAGCSPSNYLPEYGRSSGGQMPLRHEKRRPRLPRSVYDFIAQRTSGTRTVEPEPAANPLLAQPVAAQHASVRRHHRRPG